MTYQDIVAILMEQSPQAVFEMLGFDEDIEFFLEAIDDYIDTHQDTIITKIEENGLI